MTEKKYGINQLNCISTFGQYMICPTGLVDKKEALSKKGVNDFINYKFRHVSVNYDGSSIDSEKLLLEKIIDALESSLSSIVKSPLLLLSDGKDSMGLALALSNAGIKCKTLTFLRRSDDRLRNYITSVAQELGHKPYFVTVDEIVSCYELDFFMKACAEMETPVLDQGFLFFLFGCKFFFEKSGFSPKEFVIVDGLGNDEYFGYLPSKNQLKSFSLSRLGIWKFIPRFLSGLRWYIRSPSEAQGDLSALAAFFPFGGSYDLNEFFSQVPCSLDALEFVDFRAFSRGAFHDHQCMMGKTVTTAKSLGTNVVFPWTESSLSSYCFNLPVSAKFDFRSLKNKLLLRRLLEKEIGWKQEKRGVDLYFDLNLKEFKKNILNKIVPQHVIEKIDKSVLMPNVVKQRAYLELHNFYGYCLTHGLSLLEIESILMGRR